jgi:hypothetical protein
MSMIDRIEGQKFGVDLIGKEIMDLADLISAMKGITEARKESDGKLDHFFFGANSAYKLMLEKVQAIQKRINKVSASLDEATAYELACMEEDCVHH